MGHLVARGYLPQALLSIRARDGSCCSQGKLLPCHTKQQDQSAAVCDPFPTALQELFRQAAAGNRLGLARQQSTFGDFLKKIKSEADK